MKRTSNKFMFIIVMLSLIFLNLSDLFVTGVSVTYGIATEANPLMASIINRYGIGGLAVIKTAVIIFIFCLLYVKNFLAKAVENEYLLTLSIVVAAVYLVVISYSIINLIMRY